MILAKDQIIDLLLAIITGVVSFFSSVGSLVLAALLVVCASGINSGLSLQKRLSLWQYSRLFEVWRGT